MKFAHHNFKKLLYFVSNFGTIPHGKNRVGSSEFKVSGIQGVDARTKTAHAQIFVMRNRLLCCFRIPLAI